MMNKNDKQIPAKYRGVTLSSGIAIIAVTMLIFALLMLIMMKLGVIAVPSFLQTILGSNDAAESVSEHSENIIPDFASNSIASTEIYNNSGGDANAILESVSESGSYVREFRVVNSYGGKNTIRMYTLVVKGSSYRLESESRTVICDGENARAVTGTYSLDLDTSVFTIESETGTTPLSEIKEAAKSGSVALGSVNDKSIVVTSMDEATGIVSEYVISIETGVVMSERSYLNGEVYRIVITDSVDVFAADSFTEDFFRIP